MVNFKGTEEWVELFNYGLDGDDVGILEDLWRPIWNDVAWNLPPPGFQNKPTTFAQYAGSSEADGNGYTTIRNGSLVTFYGTQALSNLYADYASTVTTYTMESIIGVWENTVVGAKLQQLFDQTYNAVANPGVNGSAPPVFPAQPAPFAVDGIPSASAMWLAVADLVEFNETAPLPGSPATSRVVVAFAPPPTT